MTKPYPGFSPSYRSVKQTGGYFRTCIVVELLTIEQLNSGELATIQERLEATIGRLQTSNIESVDVVLPDRFDSVLKEGLRLSDK